MLRQNDGFLIQKNMHQSVSEKGGLSTGGANTAEGCNWRGKHDNLVGKED